MIKIINVTELQRKTKQIIRDVQDKPHIVISNGAAKMLLLPYVEEWEEKIKDYSETFYLEKQRSILQPRYQKSLESGQSDLQIL